MPEEGTTVQVEVRDMQLADRAAETVVADEAVISHDAEGWSATVEVDVPDDTDPSGLTVWARVAASGEDRVSEGDWITMQSLPVSPGGGEIAVPVRRVGG